MSTTASETTYRSILKREFENRCKRNPRYSLRSFARDLGISPNRLSEVLKGRYGISRKAAEQMTKRLNFAKQEALYFCDLVDSKHSRSPIQRAHAQQRLQVQYQDLETQQLSMDAFKVVSDWYHYAIMELALTENFVDDSNWIGSKIGVPETIISVAIDRLLSLGLLERVDGKLRPSSNSTAAPSDVPSEAIRKFHRQVLEKAIQAIDHQDISKRDLSSIVLAVDTKDLPDIKKAIKEFRRNLALTFGRSGTRDDVYCLGIQFFSVLENPNRAETQ